ncbi:CbiX/SirB N-terminal domain-containing protein [uncultured Roseovarius sp.]|uniref:CbiX/SirB N-terminal domain-containing protein n=1 Tax=uncultured Roseovarius sp. TaxID=293344 RepID=UPI00260B231F|nr:CbiX/SirB N-terminal domain-containing protein [uncultured Roseovarius sp.]
MSSTRSPSRRAQAIKRSAIIVSHGQPSDPLPAEADLKALSAKVAGHLPDWLVTSATLANPGALDAALAATDGTPLIYPLFMTDGWFVRSALPKRLGDAPAHILPPLGVEPDLPDLVATHLCDALAGREWAPQATTLLVASHGSGRSPKSKQATEAFVAKLGAAMRFAGIRTGYVEEAPFFGDVAMGCRGQTLCLPFFAAYGGHVKDDITDALSVADFKGALLDPIGTFQTIPAFVAKSLRKAARSQVTA